MISLITIRYRYINAIAIIMSSSYKYLIIKINFTMQFELSTQTQRLYLLTSFVQPLMRALSKRNSMINVTSITASVMSFITQKILQELIVQIQYWNIISRGSTILLVSKFKSLTQNWQADSAASNTTQNVTNIFMLRITQDQSSLRSLVASKVRLANIISPWLTSIGLQLDLYSKFELLVIRLFILFLLCIVANFFVLCIDKIRCRENCL